MGLRSIFFMILSLLAVFSLFTALSFSHIHSSRPSKLNGGARKLIPPMQGILEADGAVPPPFIGVEKQVMSGSQSSASVQTSDSSSRLSSASSQMESMQSTSVNPFLRAVQKVQQPGRDSASPDCEYVRNGGFELHVADATQFPGWTEPMISDWPRFFADMSVAHGGSVGLRLEGKYSLHLQHIQVDQKDRTPLLLSIWLKGQDVQGPTGIYADVELQDGRFVLDQTAMIPHGSYDWQQLSIQLDYPMSVRAVTLFLVMRDCSGKLWVDDVSIKQEQGSQSSNPISVVWNGQGDVESCKEDQELSELWTSKSSLPESAPRKPVKSCWQLFAGVENSASSTDFGAKKQGITLATHMTPDRLQNVADMGKRWSGPMLAVVCIRSWDVDVSKLRSALSSLSEEVKQRLAVHVLHWGASDYPVNLMRNSALDLVGTSHTMLIDADFIPSAHAYDHLMESLQSVGKKDVLVVPAFEVPANQLPEDKVQLRAAGAQVVQASKSQCAHGPTQSGHWMGSSDMFEVTDKHWPKEELCYEPYIVAPHDMPRFDTRFVAYGGDKASHSWELREEGRRMVVQPKAFIVHQEHEHAAWRKEYNWTRAWYNIMGFRAKLESANRDDWPAAPCFQNV